MTATIAEELREIAEWLLKRPRTVSHTIKGNRLLAIAERLDGKCIVSVKIHKNFKGRVYEGYGAMLACGCTDDETLCGDGSTPAGAIAALQAELDKGV